MISQSDSSADRKPNSKVRPAHPKRITERFVHTVCSRIAADKRVRRNLPDGGRIHVDRQLPFLCLYRQPLSDDDLGTDELVTGEAAYLTASGKKSHQKGLMELLTGFSRTAVEHFGACLIIEVWASTTLVNDDPNTESAQTPEFIIHAPPDGVLDHIVDTLDGALSRMRVAGRTANTKIIRSKKCSPQNLSSLMPTVAKFPSCSLIGLEVKPIYRDHDNKNLYTLLLREFRRGLSRSLRQGFYEFVQNHTTTKPAHFHVLGRRAVVKAVWQVDQKLADVADGFDFLLQVTPVNAEQAWREFQRDRFDKTPKFRYRPIPVDPVVLKRRLYEPPMEKLEDPAILMLFRQKQDELDRQITMLLDRNSKRFLHGSIQVYGGVSRELERVAMHIVEQFPARTRDDSRQGFLDARQFAALAEREIEYYRNQSSEVTAQVHVRSDIGRALMVSKGSLFVGDLVRIPAARADALIAHEVGTHVLTYYNGLAQPFQQLHTGLAGYEALQEGLAVLAEYLAGGLSRPRLRLLAARVIVVRDMIQGASFIDSFRRLYHNYGFEGRTAFTIAMRAFRGGGLTKDAVYLQGLVEVLKYIQRGGEIAPLFLGKIATTHITIIRELQWRGVLKTPPLTPKYLSQTDAMARFDRLRDTTSVLDLIVR